MSSALPKNPFEIYQAGDDCECVSVDGRVSDQWCVDDCICDWCPGCNQGYCEGFCDYYCDKPPVTDPPTVGPTDEPGPTTSTVYTTAFDPNNHPCEGNFTWNVIYLDYSIDYNDLGTDIQTCVDYCYNVIIISFWISGRFADAAQVWVQTMDEDQRQAALKIAHDAGAYVLLAAGGATENIEHLIDADDGTSYGKSAAEDAVKYGFDGVDFDVELQPGNNEPFHDGSFQKFIIDASHAARQVLGPNRLITHAPQAPYLGVWAGEPGYGYTEILAAPDCEIDFVNIQFYNQCPTCYSTFDSLMVDGDAEGGDHSLTGQSALKQIIQNGVPPERLVIGKPIGPSGFANNGYVDPVSLHDWGCQVMNEDGYNGWHTGYMTWMYRKSEPQLVESWGKAVASTCSGM